MNPQPENHNITLPNSACSDSGRTITPRAYRVVLRVVLAQDATLADVEEVTKSLEHNSVLRPYLVTIEGDVEDCN